MTKIYTTLLLISSFQLNAQDYTSWLTGNSADMVSSPTGGICMMGGASENDEAMKWFLQRSDGGDILVLRASGSDGYNDYLYTDLGITVNSVETILFNTSAAASDSYIHDKINKAEAIWFAGGDQWDYVSYWRDTPIDSLINKAINERNIVIGGTSAGMAILGEYYFSAENGTVTSPTALSNPYNNAVTVDSSPFLENNYLQNVITDTHYDNPDRRGRHTVFIARVLQDTQTEIRGIACDEYTAVCIDENGLARVFGEWPAYDENAYFIQTNCALTDPTPENCAPSTPLTWNRGGQALKVYQVKGTMAGTYSLDLNDWQSGNGGTWKHWSVQDGILTESNGTAPDCGSLSITELTNNSSIFPNPLTGNLLSIESDSEVISIQIHTCDGKIVPSERVTNSSYRIENPKTGIYTIVINFEKERVIKRLIIE